MKIVVNRTYGGFRLSHEAKMLLFKLKGITVFPYKCEHDYDKREYVYSAIKPDFIEKGGITYDTISYFQVKPQEVCFVRKIDEDWDKYPDYKEDFDFGDISRSDEDLVTVVERLGDKADYAPISKLAIVEIPDDYDYMVDSYDGIETVYAGRGLIMI